MRKYVVKMDYSWIEYKFNFFTGAHSEMVLSHTSPIGKWLADREIKYSFDSATMNKYRLELDIDESTGTEFILTWGEILCVD